MDNMHGYIFAVLLFGYFRVHVHVHVHLFLDLLFYCYFFECLYLYVVCVCVYICIYVYVCVYSWWRAGCPGGNGLTGTVPHPLGCSRPCGRGARLCAE